VTDYTADDPVALLAIATLVQGDAVASAERMIGAIAADAAERSSPVAYALAYTSAARLALRCGDVLTAEADSRRAADLSHRHGLGVLALLAMAIRCEALLERARVREAVAAIDSVALEPEASTVIAAHILLARGRVRLADGQIREAVDDIREAGAMSVGLLGSSPDGLAWRSALALAGAEDADELVRAELAIARRIRALADLGRALNAMGEPGAGHDCSREALALAARAGATALALDALADLHGWGVR
jgi:hypothetical protein